MSRCLANNAPPCCLGSGVKASLESGAQTVLTLQVHHASLNTVKRCRQCRPSHAWRNAVWSSSSIVCTLRNSNVRFGEMFICILLAILVAGVSFLCTGSGRRSWAWAFNVETFASLSRTERVCGHVNEKTVLDLLHVLAVVSAWVVVGEVESIRLDKTVRVFHLRYHIFLRTALPRHCPCFW